LIWSKERGGIVNNLDPEEGHDGHGD
jgi:hypothetical protein